MSALTTTTAPSRYIVEVLDGQTWTQSGWTFSEPGQAGAEAGRWIAKGWQARVTEVRTYPYEVVETTVVASNTEVARRRALAAVNAAGFRVDPTPVRNDDTERVGVRCARYVVVFRTVDVDDWDVPPVWAAVNV